jgi:hypothetical protein
MKRLKEHGEKLPALGLDILYLFTGIPARPCRCILLDVAVVYDCSILKDPGTHPELR